MSWQTRERAVDIKRIEDDLHDRDSRVVIDCLYKLSGSLRGAALSPASLGQLRNLILSENEEISWRALFFLGLVLADPPSLPFIIQRLLRDDYDELVFSTGIDAIFVIAARHSVRSVELSTQVINQLATSPRPEVARRSELLRRFLAGEIDENQYRAAAAFP